MAPRRQWLLSSVATKVVIALTGLSLVGFLCVHLAGNLLLYLGPAAFNAYSHALIANPLIIPVEIGPINSLVPLIGDVEATWVSVYEFAELLALDGRMVARLGLSLSGVRDISALSVPPPGRQEIETVLVDRGDAQGEVRSM